MSIPATWTKFSKTSNGKEYRFKIVEIHKNNYDEFFNFFFKYFVADEPMHKVSGIAKKVESLKEYRKIYKEQVMGLNLQIEACFLEDDVEGLKMVAGSIMQLEKKGDPQLELKELMPFIESKEVRYFLTMINYMHDIYNKGFKEIYNLESYYGGFGVVVHPDYRGLGIAGEILKVRVAICKAHGVPMTGAWMTSAGTQKAAKRLGWETVLEINYKDLEEIAEVSFAGEAPTAKFMVAKAQSDK